MPVFPKLKVLKVIWEQRKGAFFNDERFRAQKMYGLILTFPAGENEYLNYAHNFPSLRSLTLLPPPNRFDQVKVCSETFFPIEAGAQVCETLVHLEIPIQLHGPQILEMFPNVERVQEAMAWLGPIFHLQKEMMSLV